MPFEVNVGNLLTNCAHKRTSDRWHVSRNANQQPIRMPVLSCFQAKLVALYQLTQLLDVLIDFVESLSAHKSI